MIINTARVIGAILALLWLASLAEAAAIKIAVVDSAEVIFNSAAGKRAQVTLKRKAEELGRDLSRRRNDLGRQIEDFQKKAGIMKKDARVRREEELSKKELELRKKLGASEKEFAQMREREFKPLFDKFNRIIKQISEEDGYTLIIDKRAAITYSPEIDITGKVQSAFGR